MRPFKMRFPFEIIFSSVSWFSVSRKGDKIKNSVSLLSFKMNVRNGWKKRTSICK